MVPPSEELTSGGLMITGQEPDLSVIYQFLTLAEECKIEVAAWFLTSYKKLDYETANSR